MPEEVTVADALTELKRIATLYDTRCANINTHSSKKKGNPDTVDGGQLEYIRSQRQSAEDLLKRYNNIKLVIQRSNLDTTFEFDGKTYTIAEALHLKQYGLDKLDQLYDSFNDLSAKRQLSDHISATRVNTTAMSEEELVTYQLVPELFYSEREVQERHEEVLNLRSYLDALIEKSNHGTTITI